MSQHDGGGGGGGGRGRRLSMLARDSMNSNQIDMEREILKRLSSSFQQVRLSNNPAQTGSISVAPTPVNVRGNYGGQQQQQGAGARKGINSSLPRSNLPIRSGQKQVKQSIRPSSSAVKGPPKFSSNSSYQLSAKRDSVRIPQPPRSAAHPVVSALRKPGNLTRATSVDANHWPMNSFVTPTPGKSARSRSKSPMSMRRWGSASDVGGMTGAGTKIKIPTGRDEGAKTILYDMAAVIIRFMDSKGYHISKEPKDLVTKLVTKEYYKMVQFAAQFVVGPQYLQVQEGELCAKIADLAVLLKYGAPVTKSHLKSIAGNAISSCLGFLCWLCTRAAAVESRMEHVNNPTLIAGLHKDGWVQFSRDNLLQIFYCERLSWNLSHDDKLIKLDRTIAAQLEDFQARFYEAYMNETDYGLEQLELIKNEKLQELAVIQAKPDPARDAYVALEAAKQKLIEVTKRVEDCKTKITTYREMHSLRSKFDSVKSEIQSKSREILTLTTNVKNQPINKQGERKLLNEIEAWRKERETLQTMLVKLSVEVEKRRQVKSNLDDKLRQFMTQFTIVETCNTNLLNLGLNDFTIPTNPMSAGELTSWLDIADEKLENARNAIDDTIKTIQQNQHEIEVKDRKCSSDIKDFKKELELLKMTVHNNTSSLSVSEDDAERRLKALEDKYHDMCSQLSYAKSLIEKRTREAEELKAHSHSLELEYRKKCDAMQQWDDFLLDYEVKAQNSRTEVLKILVRRHQKVAIARQEYLAAKRLKSEFVRKVKNEKKNINENSDNAK